jgi:hypothetical protein
MMQTNSLKNTFDEQGNLPFSGLVMPANQQVLQNSQQFINISPMPQNDVLYPATYSIDFKAELHHQTQENEQIVYRFVSQHNPTNLKRSLATHKEYADEREEDIVSSCVLVDENRVHLSKNKNEQDIVKSLPPFVIHELSPEDTLQSIAITYGNIFFFKLMMNFI